MVAATEPTTIQKAVQLAGALTDEALRNGTIKRNTEKRGHSGELGKDKSERNEAVSAADVRLVPGDARGGRCGRTEALLELSHCCALAMSYSHW